MKHTPDGRTFEEIQVDPPGMWDNEQGPKDWYAISDTEGVFAYCGDEKTASLLAAAPELLEALKLAHDAILGVTSAGWEPNQIKPVLNDINNAIRKAEGENK